MIHDTCMCVQGVHGRQVIVIVIEVKLDGGQVLTVEDKGPGGAFADISLNINMI